MPMELDDVLKIAGIRKMCASGDARRVRLARKLSLGELASVLGSSPAVVARWETGACRPRPPAALRYASLISALVAIDDLPRLGDGQAGLSQQRAAAPGPPG